MKVFFFLKNIFIHFINTSLIGYRQSKLNQIYTSKTETFESDWFGGDYAFHPSVAYLADSRSIETIDLRVFSIFFFFLKE